MKRQAGVGSNQYQTKPGPGGRMPRSGAATTAAAVDAEAEEVAFQFHAQSADWREQAGCRTLADVSAWEQAGCRHPSDAARWTLRGVDAVQARLFLSGDYGPGDVDDWKLRFDGNPDISMDDLSGWAAYGFGPSTTAGLLEQGTDLSHRAAQWEAAGFGPRDRGEWAAVFDNPTEAAAWKNMGFAAWQADEYLEAGVDRDIAQGWSHAGFSGVHCKDWLGLGIRVEEAVLWNRQGFEPKTARSLIADGWTGFRAHEAGLKPFAGKGNRS